MLFFIFSFILFVGATIVFIRQEDSYAKKSLAVSNQSASSVEQKIEELKSVDTYTAKHLEETRDILDNLTKRIEWAEMKASVPQTKIVQSSHPLKVEPITINVVYKRKANKVTAETKVIKSVRDKMKSVNQ